MVTRRRAAVVLSVALLATGAACTENRGRHPDPAAVAARAFLDAWAAGDDAKAGAGTDDPSAAQAALQEVRRRLRVQSLTVRPGQVRRSEGSGPRVPYSVTLRLAGLGDWSYDATLPLVQTTTGGAKRWLVDWSPSAVHPGLTAATRLARTRERPARAPILDRNSEPLMTERPVVEVGVEPRRLSDPARAYAALAAAGVDATKLAARVATAPPTQLVPAITLRQEDFQLLAPMLRATPGLVFRDATATLAPTPTFGRGLLGTVRPATAETLAKAGPLALATDDVGASGLQQAFQAQLAGTPGGEVRLVSRADASTVQVLHTFPATPGTPLRTTLDRSVQNAAERALAPVGKPGSLVVVRPSTGEILAAASSPAAESYNRAFQGRYPPGSTFKIVTAAALLRRGLDRRAPVPCAESVTVEGKRFENYDGLGSLGEVPFERSFVESCNTAFITAAGRLPGAAVPQTAGLFGLGRRWSLGVPAYAGSVPPPASRVEQAATAIGQGRVLVSPLAMAVVAAAVQSGTPRPPVLLSDAPPATGGASATASPPATAAPLAALPAPVAPTLRSLMQLTVAEGTARVLALPGEPVGAKTGTAEFGTQRPPRRHAWMVGFRGDLAFAVLVEDGESGARTAGPVARAFLSALR